MPQLDIPVGEGYKIIFLSQDGEQIADLGAGLTLALSKFVVDKKLEEDWLTSAEEEHTWGLVFTKQKFKELMSRMREQLNEDKTWGRDMDMLWETQDKSTHNILWNLLNELMFLSSGARIIFTNGLTNVCNCKRCQWRIMSRSIWGMIKWGLISLRRRLLQWDG